MSVLTVSNISHTVSFLTVSKLTFTLPISVDFDSALSKSSLVGAQHRTFLNFLLFF